MNCLAECLEDFRSLKTSPAEFQAQVCPRCRQAKCELSRFAHDPMTQRVATQPERFFHPNQADPRSSRYTHLVDFESLLHRAMQLEVANRRGDWVIPEIPILDGRIEQAASQSTEQVEAAVRSLRGGPPTSLVVPVPAAPAPPPEIIEPEVIKPAPVTVKPAPVIVPKKAPEQLPPTRNVPTPDQGIMIGGGPPPKALPPPPAVDPWASPTPGPKVVKPGSRIRFGLTGEIDDK